MNELLLQDKYLIHFLTKRVDGLGYQEVKPNTVSTDTLLIEDDLKTFLKETELNKTAWKKLLPQFGHDETKLMKAFIDFLLERMKDGTNMAIFINRHKTITFKGISFHLFYPSGSEIYGDRLFEQNIFSVVQEMPYTFKYQKKKKYSFRPDITFFLNGIYIGYTELKSNYNNQNAWKNGRKKVMINYEVAVDRYLEIAADNDKNESIKKDFLKIFRKAIHITTTDIEDTFVIRNIMNHFDALRNPSNVVGERYRDVVEKDFKPYPLRKPKVHYGSKTEQFEEVFRALYAKEMLEKEILYYNFIERELKKDKKTGKKVYHNKTGRLIAPRPKQKFGADKILSRIDEFLDHENDDDYFINKLRRELKDKGIGTVQAKELIEQRMKYKNNKNVYSLLLQYAAGFGKSNIICWTVLQLKDLKRQGEYVYDKILLVVDRLQLRDQLDSLMFNMNISKSLYTEVRDQATFKKALATDIRILVVNLQKFNTIKNILSGEVLANLGGLRIAFIIDEIHRSHSNTQHEEMVGLFKGGILGDLQEAFDQKAYTTQRKKKNLLIGFTATPSEQTLNRFGEFDIYAESQQIMTPFDSYTMAQAIEDGYILNPLNGLVPVAAKMYYEIPEDPTAGLTEEDREYSIKKKKVYENLERLDAISEFLVQRLVSAVYPNIRGAAKAMLAVSSVELAIAYHGRIKEYFQAIVTQHKKYERFKEAPIYIVYSSDGQKHKSASPLNGNLTEAKVLENFALKKNGLIIVVDKLQTGFDEPKLHTLFLDKEIKGINAIQTISRVNRKAKYKEDCKIVDFSYKNVNINNIRRAFEQFSNVVVSDFDPLEKETYLEELYQELRGHDLYTANFSNFMAANTQPKDVAALLQIESHFTNYIRSEAAGALELKQRINKYYHTLHLIEFLIELNNRYTEPHFLDFWHRYNNEYN
ncbi:MAG: DEAD/DEAH box helicase family protein, partial [Bacteroidota bacterium]